MGPLLLAACETEPIVTTTTTETRQEIVRTQGDRVVGREVIVSRNPPAVQVEQQTVAPGPAICLDTRVLAMDRSRLRLGAWQLGGSSENNGGLRSRRMAASSRGMGMGAGPLAIGRRS